MRKIVERTTKHHKNGDFLAESEVKDSSLGKKPAAAAFEPKTYVEPVKFEPTPKRSTFSSSAIVTSASVSEIVKLSWLVIG